MNFIIDVDSYKPSHYLQFPPETSYMFSYLESRGGKYNHIMFAGLQMILKKYFTTPITMEMVEEAHEFYTLHGEPFNLEGWTYIAKNLSGKLPIRIRAVPEGTLVPVGNVLMTVESTDPKVFWIVSWVETQLMRLWYPTTVATESYHIRKSILHYLDKTSDNPLAEIPFKLNDFGARGVSSRESSGIGGAAHLMCFQGSDNGPGIYYANKFYNHVMSALSIPAAEHSSITMWGRTNEVKAYRNMLKQFGQAGKTFAVVSDSYDLYDAIKNLWGEELKHEVIASGATVVIRPDSGDPKTVVLNSIELLGEKFGFSVNSKNYKVLNYVRVIQGDGINHESIQIILDEMERWGWSATNIFFGMGGALLQQLNRDTQEFAYKCSNAIVDGLSVDVFKDPLTDHNKASKRGKIDLVKRFGQFITVPGSDIMGSELHEVYMNGELTKTYTLNQIRNRCMS